MIDLQVNLEYFIIKLTKVNISIENIDLDNYLLIFYI